MAVGVAAALPFIGLTGAGHHAGPVGVDRPQPTVVIVAAPHGTGDDCTTAKPCGLTVAQGKARILIAGMDSDIAVELQGGTYHLTHTLQLGPLDSGRNGFHVVYRAAPGAHPVLSGAKRITGWRKVAGKANIWWAPIPKGFDTRQLYINGHRMQNARTTLGGVGMVQTPDGYLASSGKQIDAWPDPSNIEAVFRGGNGPWTQTACPIASISGTTMKLAQPCWDNLHLKALGVQELAWFDDPMGGFGGLASWKAPTFYQNVYAALAPGKWVIDRAGRGRGLYYVPRKGEVLAKQHVVVPALQTLLAIDGTPAHPVHDVTVSGLTFSYGTWTATDTPNGFPQMQADFYLTGKDANTLQGTCQYNKPRGSCPFANWTRTPANVVLTSTERVSMLGNRFVHLGGAGLDLYDGAKHDLVEGNEFADIAASGIQLGATDDPLPDKAYGGMRERHVTVANNYVHNVANQYLGGIGIWLGYTAYSLITHNYIEHVPYTAISIGWGGWHQTVLAGDRNPNGNAHNVVSNNLMYDYMHILGDGGAIYSNGSQGSTWDNALQEIGNVAYRGTNNDFSLYTDAASRYVKVGGNFVYFQPIDSFATGGCHTYGHIRIFNNYFAQAAQAYPCFLYTDIVTTGGTSVCEVPDPASAPKPIMRRAGLEPRFRHLINRYRPEVDLVGPEQIATGGGEVMISGGGFTPQSVVKFGDKVATKVKVLSGNYILATAPAGSGKVPVTVTNAHGKSPQNAYSHFTYAQSPMPCQLSSGTGVTTGLLS
ncbi:MAG TPA: IPT/TIG domain-containing protein [Mycobacteriales bacterium]|nr:IPT/TIG domain-containing protein [Mycobacteriales bacterium]